MNKNISFLIADDDKNIVLSLRTMISTTFTNVVIHTAYDGTEAWEMFQIHQPMIVITDITMPNLSGFQLMKRIRESEEHFKTYIIVITANMEKNQRLLAVEEGADDFIIKPFTLEELTARLTSAYRISDMQSKLLEENTLLGDLANALHRDMNDMTLLALKFCQARIPSSVDMLKRVADASLWIAKKLGDVEEEDISDIEISALLSYCGKVFLPDSLINKPVMVNGSPTDNLMYQVPVFAKEIVSNINMFKNVSDILYSLYENFDGSGIPEKQQSWQIPIGSRIIRVVLDYEELLTQGKDDQRKILEYMKLESKRLYDHRIVTLLEQYLATYSNKDTNLKERALNLEELEDGMILSRDIITNSGLKVMSAGAVLKLSIIEKIRTINTSDPIIGSVFVKK